MAEINIFKRTLDWIREHPTETVNATALMGLAVALVDHSQFVAIASGLGAGALGSMINTLGEKDTLTDDDIKALLDQLKQDVQFDEAETRQLFLRNFDQIRLRLDEQQLMTASIHGYLRRLVNDAATGSKQDEILGLVKQVLERLDNITPLPDKPSVFLSYGRGDDHEDYNDPEQSFLRKLYNDLTDAGFDVWWDRESMPSRSLKFIKEIEHAITAKDRLILLVGPHAMGSDYVRYEWEHARKICKPIIPILLKRDPDIDDDNDQYAQIPKPLASDNALTALDWHEPDNYAELLDTLKRVLMDDAPLAPIPGLPDYPIGYIQRDGFEDLEQQLLVKTAGDSNTPIVIAPHEMIQSIQGTGGIGKSTMAVALGRSCVIRRHFVDGIFWIRLGKSDDVDVVTRQATLGRLLGDDSANYVDAESGRVQLSRLLADKKVLLILDDVWDYKQKEAFEVLGDSCRLLMTTRLQRIANRGGVSSHKMKKLTEAEGLRLIGGWLGREAGDENPYDEQERQIVRLLDGYTQAIAIASALLADEDTGYTHDNLLERLQAGRTFKDLRLDDDDKNVNLEKSLFLSYEHLSEADQKRFRQLGIVAPNATFDADLIGAIWGDDNKFDTEDALKRLVGGALLDTEESGRWKQHSLLRAYAFALLDEQGETSGTFARYADHVIAIAEGFRLPQETWKQLDADLPHIDAIGDELTRLWGDEKGRDDDLTQRAGDFAITIKSYVFRRPQAIRLEGTITLRGMNWLETGLAVYRKADDKSRQATMLNNIGSAWDSLGDRRKALEFYNQALPLRREVGDKSGEATTLNNIGGAWDALGEKRKALEFYNQALPLFREVGDKSGEATTLNNIAAIYFHDGDLDNAATTFEQVISIMQDIGGVAEEAAFRFNLGVVYQRMGRIDDAIVQFEQSIALLHSKGLSHSASGGTIEEMQASLARLKGETPPPQDNQMEQAFAQLVGLYQAQGEDAVREALSENPPEVIEQVMAEVKRRLRG